MTERSENNDTHDRLDDLMTSFTDMSYDERIQRVREIRQGRVMPSVKKATKPKVAKSRGKKLDNMLAGFSPEQMAALKARIEKKGS